jgi:hypothetical protein
MSRVALDATATGDSTATATQPGTATTTAQQTATATASLLDPVETDHSSGPQPRQRPHGTAQHRDRDSTRTSVLPSLGPRLNARPSLAHVPRARRISCRIARTSGFIRDFEHFYTPHRRPARHPLRPILEHGKEAICWRPEPSSVRATARTCSQSGPPAVGEVWGLRANRVPTDTTTCRVTTSDDTMGRTLGWD